MSVPAVTVRRVRAAPSDLAEVFARTDLDPPSPCVDLGTVAEAVSAVRSRLVVRELRPSKSPTKESI
jgi:hypothetical protein